MKRLTLVKLALICCVTACGNATHENSTLNGTPEEGDVIVANLRMRYAQAQVLRDPRFVQPYIGRHLRCESYDARSFRDPDSGGNNSRYFVTIRQRPNGLFDLRFDLSDGSGSTSTISGAVDDNGLGFAAVSTRGGCFGSRSVEYFRREFDGSLVSEVLRMDTCRQTQPAASTVPVTAAGIDVLSYTSCRMF